MTGCRWSKVILSLIFLPLLAGCWDRLEIEDRAVILGIAVDKVEGKTEAGTTNSSHLQRTDLPLKQGLLEITVQIAIPGRIPLGPGGSGEQSNKPSTQPIWVLSVQGHTIDDALSNLQQQLADQLFYGHLRVIAVSEEMAKSGIQNLNDFFRRQPQVRRTAWMVITKGRASDLMRTNPQLERVPTLYLQSTMDHAVEMGKFPNDFLGMFWSSLSARGREGYLPYIELKKEGNIEIAGMAVFKGDRMTGKTDALSVGSYMVIVGINPGGYHVMFPTPDRKSTFVFQGTHRSSKIEVAIRDGKPAFTVTVQVEGDIREKASENVKINKNTELSKLEQEMSGKVTEGLKNFIKKTQKFDADIFGFGEYVRAKKPGYWNRNIRTSQKWQEMYKNVDIEVKARIRIRRIGVKAT